MIAQKGSVPTRHRRRSSVASSSVAGLRRLSYLVLRSSRLHWPVDREGWHSMAFGARREDGRREDERREDE